VRASLLAGLDRGRGGLIAEYRARVIAASVEDGQRQRGAHEDDGGPGGEAREHIGRGAGSEGGLRALAAEGAGEIGRAALLDEDDSDEEQTHDDVEDDDEVEENLHCKLLSKTLRG
jgi:hypothetical protein